MCVITRLTSALLCLSMMAPVIALGGQDGSTSLALELAPVRSVPGRPAPDRALSAPMPVPTRTRAKAARSTSIDPAGQCETAVTTAEYVQHLPPRLLAAISLTESGRRDPASGTFRPWPWSINAEGQGQFYASAQDAITAVKDLQARGIQSIDVGCMQVNLMYHPRAFASLEEAFDPRRNALYAAQFLNALYVANKDWMLAAGAYHSETPALAEPYRQQVAARWQNPVLRNLSPPVTQYHDFVSVVQVYGAFAQSQRVYGAFTMGTGNR
jgi:Transglycosylase SLT domain